VATQRQTRRSVETLVGFRRVERVRLVVGPTVTVAEATGVVHRYPRTVRIPIAAAGRLVAAGTPVHIEHATSEPGT